MIQPPDYASVIDPARCTAKAVRLIDRHDLSQMTYLHGSPSGATLMDITIELPAHEYLLLICPFVSIWTPLHESYACALAEARLSLYVDETPKIEAERLLRFLVQPPCRYRSDASPSKVFVGTREDDLLGQCTLRFLPTGSRIRLCIDKVPPGDGDLTISAGILGARYTSKENKDMDFIVGRVDVHGQAFPVRNTWKTSDDRDRDPDFLGQASAHDLMVNSMARKEAANLREAMEERIHNEKDHLLEYSKRRAEQEEALRKKTQEKLRKLNAQIEKAPEHKPSPVSLDESLAKAKRRLVSWGVVAMGVVVIAACLLYMGVRLAP